MNFDCSPRERSCWHQSETDNCNSEVLKTLFPRVWTKYSLLGLAINPASLPVYYDLSLLSDVTGSKNRHPITHWFLIHIILLMQHHSMTQCSLLGIIIYKLSYQWQSSLDLFTTLNLNNNKINLNKANVLYWLSNHISWGFYRWIKWAVE